MPWMRRTLRDQQVWAEVDATGELVADAGGRVAVVYKRDPAAKVYRASAHNLGAIAGAPVEADLGAGGSPPSGAPAARPAARPTERAGARRAAPAASSHRGSGATAAGDPVHVWTDGACTGNPGPAGVGVLVIDGPSRREHSEFLGHGTNNIAELTAILRGLDMVTEVSRPVRVYTDSSYSIGVLSMGWKAKANVELVAEIKQRLRAFASVEFVKVRGHAGVPENERCDELARTAVERGGR